MPPDEESFNDLAGLLVVKPAGNAGADDDELLEDDGAPDADAAGADDELEDDVDAEVEADEADDEGEDGDEDAGDGEDDAGDEEGADGSPEPLYPVMIDGKEERVTLKEALAGYSRQADYTRKTTAVSEQAKALETELGAIRAARGQYDALLQEAEKQIGPRDKERTPEQWAELRNNDPDQYAVQWADFQRREHARDALKQERQRLAEEQNEENRKALQKFLGEQETHLLTAFPDWKDKAKREAGSKAIFEWGMANGFTDKELAQVYDHRILVMADKARQWDALQARKAKVKRQLAEAPTMPAPGARQKAPTRKDAARKDAEKRFNRTGRIEDAVSLMFK